MYAGFGIVGAVFYPFYAVTMTERGLSPEGLGLLTAASALVSAAIGPLWGHLADHVWGRKNALAIGESSSAIGILLFSFGDLPMSIAGSIVMAVAGSASSGSADALALSVARDGGLRYAVTRAITSFTYATTALAAGIAIRDGGSTATTPLLALGLACILLPIPTLRERRGAAATPAKRTDRVAPARRHGWRERIGSVGEVLRLSPAFGPFVAIIFVEAFSGTAFYRFGPIQVAHLGGDAAMLGLGGALAAYVEVPFMLNVRRVIERIGLRRTFALSTTLMGFITGSTGVLDSALAITSLRLLEGASFAISLICAVEIVDRLVPQRLHATGQSLYYSSGTIGAALGGIVGGVVYANLGAPTLFVGGGVALVGTALLALKALPRSAALEAADRARRISL